MYHTLSQIAFCKHGKNNCSASSYIVGAHNTWILGFPKNQEKHIRYGKETT